PETGKPWGTRFPLVTVQDMVEMQRHLADHLGIRQWFSVTGGSLGGMQALAWAHRYPHRARSVIPIAMRHAGARLGPSLPASRSQRHSDRHGGLPLAAG